MPIIDLNKYDWEIYGKYGSVNIISDKIVEMKTFHPRTEELMGKGIHVDDCPCMVIPFPTMKDFDLAVKIKHKETEGSIPADAGFIFYENNMKHNHFYFIYNTCYYIGTISILYREEK